MDIKDDSGILDRATNPRDTRYEYDPISRLKVLQNTSYGTSAGLRFDYGYNPASQLRTVARSNTAYAFTNLYAVNRNYTTNGLNQYTAAGSASFGYDANGNLTSDGTSSYTYDIESVRQPALRGTAGPERLVSSSSGTTLTYDPLGRLWQVEKAGAVTQFLYDGDELVAEYNGSNQLLRRFVHGAGVDDPMVQYEGSELGDIRSWRPILAEHRSASTQMTRKAFRVSLGFYGHESNDNWRGCNRFGTWMVSGDVAGISGNERGYRRRGMDRLRDAYRQGRPPPRRQRRSGMLHHFRSILHCRWSSRCGHGALRL